MKKTRFSTPSNRGADPRSRRVSSPAYDHVEDTLADPNQAGRKTCTWRRGRVASECSRLSARQDRPARTDCSGQGRSNAVDGRWLLRVHRSAPARRRDASATAQSWDRCPRLSGMRRRRRSWHLEMRWQHRSRCRDRRSPERSRPGTHSLRRAVDRARSRSRARSAWHPPLVTLCTPVDDTHIEIQSRNHRDGPAIRKAGWTPLRQPIEIHDVRRDILARIER